MKTNYKIGINFPSSLFILCLLFFLNVLNAQPADTKTVLVLLTDKITKESIPFANVVVFDLKGEQMAVATSDIDGACKFILPAKDNYILKGVYVGYFLKQDTLSCNLPGCNRTHTMALESNNDFCFCCTCSIMSEPVQNEEEAEELERKIERMQSEDELREDLNDFVCYPNPASEVLNVSINGIEATELLLFNTDGALLMKKQVNLQDYQFEIDLSLYAKGAYYAVCRGAGLSSHTQTIIKQ